MVSGPKYPMNHQKSAGNKGTYIPLSTAFFIKTVVCGMSYPASLRTCGRYEFFNLNIRLDTHQKLHPQM